MLTYWTDLDRTLNVMDEFRRRLDHFFTDPDANPSARRASGLEPSPLNGFPRVSFKDHGPRIEFVVELPGLKQDELKLTLEEDRITLAGTRTCKVPEGYSVHRRERPSVQFNRSFALPCRVDAEKANAVLNSGVLRLTLEKHPESQPRQIPIAVS